MLQRITIASLAGLVFGSALTAQQSTTPAEQDAKTPAAAAPAETKTSADYVRDLASGSFRVRTQAERALRAMGKDALPELKKCLETEGDAESQWRARRLVRQIERGDTGGLARRSQDEAKDDSPAQRGGAPMPRGIPGQGLQGTPFQGFVFPGPGGFDDMQQRFDQLFKSLESDFGIDIPRHRFFRDDFFQDLQDQMQGMQQGPGSSNQSMSMQMGPDGVRVEVKTRNDKGEEETKVYEAPDLQSFQQKYPGVLQKSGIGGLQWFGGQGNGPGSVRVFGNRGNPGGPGGMHRFWTDDDGAFSLPGQRTQADDLDSDLDSEPDAAAMPLPPAGKRLGIVVKPEIPSELRSYLGIEGGLMVEQVQQGTLAEALQLQAGDIVLAIGGTAIGATKDVQAALAAIAAGTRVDVKILRRGKELELHADKPSDAAGEPAPAPKKESEPLQKRPRDGAIR